MSLDSLKKFGLDTSIHSESKVKRFRSMIKLLEKESISKVNDIEAFIEDIEKKVKTEEISNIFNTRFGTKYAHSSARDLLNCLKSILEQFNSMTDSHSSSSSSLLNKKGTDISQVISLAEELNKNHKNQNIDDDLKVNINKLILKKIQDTISKLI